jgi:hypothetical protein
MLISSSFKSCKKFMRKKNYQQKKVIENEVFDIYFCMQKFSVLLIFAYIFIF